MSEWHAGNRLAIFGALPQSLGEAVSYLHDDDLGSFLTPATTTYGPGRVQVHGEEGGVTEAVHDREWVWPGSLGERRRVPDLSPYDNVLITMGVNMSEDEDPWGYKQMEVNYHGPVALMDAWARLGKEGHCVVISSNSAYLARSPSRGYCASKAALSMAVRAQSRKGYPGIFYAWEFGLLEGTPMTAEATRALGPDVAMTRMKGLPNGIPVDLAAGHVYRALRYGWKELNGCTLRVDAGEQ